MFDNQSLCFSMPLIAYRCLSSRLAVVHSSDGFKTSPKVVLDRLIFHNFAIFANQVENLEHYMLFLQRYPVTKE